MVTDQEIAALKNRGSLVGIMVNLVLSSAKLAAGLATHSVAIIAEAANNFADAASVVVAYFGFRLAREPAGKEHPFGHGRYEYIASFVVTLMILLMAFELGKSSVMKIINPMATSPSKLAIIILVISIAVKVGLAFFYHHLYKKTDSEVFRATTLDSLSDTMATSVVIIGTLLSWWKGWLIDGWLGLLVSFMILYAGITTMRASISLLLGEAPTEEMVQDIRERMLKNKHILGVHDIVVQSYGEGMYMISLHAEVDASQSLLHIHHEIDLLEHELMAVYPGSTVIHIDPVVIDDERTRQVETALREALFAVNPQWVLHDFRIIMESHGPHLYFDVMVPPTLLAKADQDAMLEQIKQVAYQVAPRVVPVVHIEPDYGVICDENELQFDLDK